MATSKGKNSSRKKSNTRSTSASRKTSTKAKTTRKQKQEVEFEDPFFEDSSKEIVLWSSIALCILLCISNFGIGGVAGNAVADFLFGVFGIIQYVLPFMVAFSAFFIISNYGNKVAIAKVVAGFVLLIFLTTFVELFVNGQEILLPMDAFSYAKEHHFGGGLLGGAIAFGIYDSFGLLGAYLIVLIAMIVSTIIIIERFAFDKVQQSSRIHADRAAAKRRIRRERQLMEREASQTRYNADRQAIIDKIKQDKELELQQMQQSEGARIDRKYSGVTSNTTLIADSVESPEVTGGVNEIRFNMADGAPNEIVS